MRNLVFLFAILFSFAGMASLSYAQEDVDGEALLEQYLPDGVTLENASESQIRSAMTKAITKNTGNQAALNAITQAATNSPRVNNKVPAYSAATTVIRALGSQVTSNTVRQSVNIPTKEVIEAELAADVVGNIIRNSNLTLNEVNRLVSNAERSINILANADDLFGNEQEFIASITSRIRNTAGQAISEQRNETCTVSNGVTTCVPA